MTIAELIKELQALPNPTRDVSIVVGDEEDNLFDTWEFEIHHADCFEHPVELFVDVKCRQYV